MTRTRTERRHRKFTLNAQNRFVTLPLVSEHDVLPELQALQTSRYQDTRIPVVVQRRSRWPMQTHTVWGEP